MHVAFRLNGRGEVYHAPKVKQYSQPHAKECISEWASGIHLQIGTFASTITIFETNTCCSSLVIAISDSAVEAFSGYDREGRRSLTSCRLSLTFYFT